MFVFPHDLHVDREGNVCVTDAQGDSGLAMCHQVIKFSPEGTVLMRIGKAGIAGNGPDTLNEPCDVITAPNGDIFVSDGHSGQYDNPPASTTGRILKFTKDGKHVKEWGTRLCARAIQNAARACIRLAWIFVADRGNMRIQIFDQRKSPRPWKQFSRVSGMFIDKNDVLYAIDLRATHRNRQALTRTIQAGRKVSGLEAPGWPVTSFIPPHQTATPDGRRRGIAWTPTAIYGAEVICQVDEPREAIAAQQRTRDVRPGRCSATGGVGPLRASTRSRRTTDARTDVRTYLIMTSNRGSDLVACRVATRSGYHGGSGPPACDEIPVQQIDDVSAQAELTRAQAKRFLHA